MEERIDNETVQQIDLISMLKDIGREWLTILLLAISAALFADIWICATYQPEYRTSTTFVVTTKGMNNNIYQNLNSTKGLAQQFTEILGSNVLKKKVAQDLGMNSLDVETSVDLVPETNLITLTVKAGTAAESYRVLQSVMENYNTVSDYAIRNVIIETIQQPSVAMAPINPLDEKRTVVKVFIVAAGCLIALLAGISYIRDTIKNPGEVSTKLDTRLLGTIAYEKKSGALSMKRKKDYLSMLIQNPLRSFAYVESSKMAASRVRSYMDKEAAKVLLVTSVMENEGKSTVAANLVKWESTIAGKLGYCGVAGNRGSSPIETPNTHLWQLYGEGCQYIDEYAYCRYPEYTDKVIDGERAGVWYTEIHRKYKYPEFEGENFLTPCITWNRMANDGYKIRIFDEIIWICKYLEDGLTMQGNLRFIKNPAGAGLCLREKANFLHYSSIEKMKMWYTFYCDHTFCEKPYRLTKKQCAEYIGAPLCMIYADAMIHGISRKIKEKK